MKNLLLTFGFLSLGIISIAQGDDCFNATPLGTLPAPAACPLGTGSTFTYNGTTVGATAENPYSSLSCMDAPAADVWVTFVASGNEMDLDFTSGLNDANIGIYTGDCTTGLTGLFCETSNNGNISTTLSPFTPGETYYMQISGINETDFSNFSLDLTNYLNCSLCVLESNITASPPPLNGFYLPGTTVQFCLEITEFEQISANWLHGVLPSFGAAWDIGSITPISSPNASGAYDWIWTDPPGGDPLGWWVDNDPNGPAVGDGDPTNNFGDSGVDGTGSWTWCWEITTSAACTSGGDLSMSVNTTADGETGSWSSPACTGDPSVPFQAVMMCCDIPITSFTNESCPGALDGTASATGQLGTAPYDYVFENSLGNVVFTQNNVADGVASTATGLGADTYTVTVTDDNGCVQIIDITLSSIGCPTPTFAAPPANITVQCIGDVPAMTNLTWNDPCMGTGSVAGTDAALVGGACGGTITRSWSFTNNCGNSVNASQTITIDDTQNPTASNPAPIAVQCIGDVPASNIAVVADEADNCTAAPVVAFVSDISDGNTCPEVITRTYSVTDDCGNTINVTQTITVDDTQNPTASNPVAVNVECIGDVPASNIAAVTDEADNCTAAPVVAFVSDVSDGNTCPEVITRTYSVTDDCGNTINVTQTITVDDITAPTGTAPADVAVECTTDVPVADPALILDEADNCTAAPIVAFVSDVSDGNTCPEVITRTYSITDDCGNVTNVTQTITVDDVTDPTASNPADINLPGGPAPAPDVTVVTDEADNCTVAPVVAFVSDVSDGGNCPETITRTYSVTDECGNTINVTQLIIIGDPFPPTGTAPADIAVQCIGDVPAADPALIVDEADNNGVPVVTHLSDVSDGNTCPEVITRTYRITDACGNVTDVVQLITVDDTQDPTASNPVAVNVECIGDVPAADITVVTDEADNCTAAPVVAFVSDVSDGNTCPEVITRTYSVTDDCGNTINVTQTITVDDITAPTGTAPADVAVECTTDVPVADPALIIDEADNCTAAPVVAFVSDVSDGNTCPEVITRTYSITDDCGNVTNVTQTITVDDVTDPTASNPADINVAGGPAPAPDVTVVTDEADNCTVAPVVAFVSDVSDGGNCPETITRTYSVTDECGNTINVTQLIIIGDPFPPTGTAPADIAVQCIGDVPAADPALIVDEADNNGVPVVTHLSDVSDGNTCPEVITRTYRLTDACGNVTDVVQLITVDDTQDPTASNPLAVNVECIGDVPAADITVVTDEADNCTAAPVVAFVSDVSDGNTCPEVITRTYSVTDDCGNTINVTQTITVDDITAPTGTAPADVAVECIGDVPVADPALIVDEADNCTAAPIVAFVSDVSDGNTCPEVITRTYSITDDCGNVTNVVQTITVDDVTDPTASNPADINQAGGVAPAPDVTVVTDEADNCTVAPVVAFVSDVSDGGNCPETITRTYSVTDECGNTINVTQLIIIGDPFPPTGTAPADIAVQCIGDVPAADPALIVDEADNNGVPVVTHLSDVSDGNTCPEVITRTYRLTDACGNVTDVVQLITVDDTQDPTASNPAAVNVECIGDVPAADITVVTDEADNCTAAPVVAFVSDVSDGNTCPEVITRTYSVTDDCGNTINVTQTITIDDVTDPTGTAPADLAVECIGDVPVADPTLITDEADNCTAAPVVAFVSDVSDGNTCPEVITRTYSITDDCGNTINVSQTIIVDDVTNPTASNPADIVAPGGPAPAPDVTVVTDEADNCTVAPVVAFVSDVSDNNPCPETITRTYSVTDDCGNQILVTQNIIITDPILPTGTPPAAIAVQCIGDVPAADPALIVDEADNNGVPVVAFVSDVSDGNTCPEVITRTYSISDACGNVVLVTQDITVDDTQDPTASNPVAVNVECIGDVPAADITVVTDEADNCTAAPVVAFVSDVSDGNTCPEVITRTYSVTDDCGNTINVTQTITVDDITAPTGTAPADVAVECIGDVPVADPALIVDEADNCTAAPVVAFVSDVSDGNTCPEVITRTYSITDDCGNVTNVTQTITVDDVTDPTASNPADIVVPGGPAPAPDVTVVTDEADNCTAAPVVAFVSDVSDNNPCPETITRTYSVTDDCGNQILVTQNIIITDPILPTGTPPAAIAVQCIGDVPAADPALIVDEADNNGVPVVAFVSDVSDGNTCPEVITRTYSITDACGNEVLVTQDITVDDTQDPTASNPVAVNVECIGDVPAADITVVTDEADNCTAAPVVAFVSDVSDGNTCPEVITRTYSVTDDCGNTINVTQTITVDDVTDPTASNPVAVNVECIGDVPAADITVVTDEADNCTAAPVVAFVSDVSDGNTCPEVITRTYSVTDDCGNTINVTQTITVDDVTDPTASNPADIDVSCASDVPAPDPSVVSDAADNCSVPVVAFVSDVTDGNVCNGETITRTYSVTDECGNSINVSQLINIDVVTPIVNAGIDQDVCEGTMVTLTADNVNGATISWNNGITDGTPFNPAVGTQTYQVTATQCGGECLAMDEVDVIVHETPLISFIGDNLMGCDPLTVSFDNLSTEQFDCSWDFGNGVTSNTCGTQNVVYQNPGTFDVTLTVTSAFGCTNTDTYADYIQVEATPVALFSASSSLISMVDTEVEFINSSLNSTNYIWSFGDQSQDSYDENPTHYFPNTIEGSYNVQLISLNDLGCADTANMTIFVQEEVIFYVPNIFTPDGDSFNEQFFPVMTSGVDPYDYHLTIFNRWGEIIFESYDYNYGWNGHYGGGGLVEDGVYVWQIEFGDTISDKKHRHRGHVTVLK